MFFRRHELNSIDYDNQSSASVQRNFRGMSSFSETSQTQHSLLQLKNLDVWGQEPVIELDEEDSPCMIRSPDMDFEYEDNNSLFGNSHLLQASRQSSFVDAPNMDDLQLIGNSYLE